MRYNHLTGKPVSEEMENVLSRLNRNEEVSLDEIRNLPEMKEAYEYESSIKPVEMSDEIKEKIKEKIKEGIIKNILDMGSVVVDEPGKEKYNGVVGKDKRLDLVIGLPASGKSSNIAIPLSQQNKARIIDSDMVKERLPGFENGWGANYVHEDSKRITKKILNLTFSQGENIVHPIVGSDTDKVKELMKMAQEYGYSVNVHYAEIEPNRALGRMLNRFLETGRFLHPELKFKYEDHVRKTYEQLKGEYDYEQRKLELTKNQPDTGRSQSKSVGYVHEVLLRRDYGRGSGSSSVLPGFGDETLQGRTLENDRTRGVESFYRQQDKRTGRDTQERLSGTSSLGVDLHHLSDGRKKRSEEKSVTDTERNYGDVRRRYTEDSTGSAVPLSDDEVKRDEGYHTYLINEMNKLGFEEKYVPGFAEDGFRFWQSKDGDPDKKIGGFEDWLVLEEQINDINKLVHEYTTQELQNYLNGEDDLVQGFFADEVKVALELHKERQKESLVIDGYSRWNMDVPRGESPILLESNCQGKFFEETIVRQELSKEITKEISKHGFKQTPEMVKAYASVVIKGSKSVSMQEMTTLYRNSALLDKDVRADVKLIGDECKKQELTKMKAPERG